MLVMLPTVMVVVVVNYLDLDFEKVLSLKEVGQPSGRLWGSNLQGGESRVNLLILYLQYIVSAAPWKVHTVQANTDEVAADADDGDNTSDADDTSFNPIYSSHRETRYT